MMSFSRAVACCCLFILVSAPLSAATWTPDPSLGDPAPHLRLYQIGRNYGDLNFDPDANLLGTHSKSPPNKKSHSTRESTYYAYGLLLTGDPADLARAQAILRRVVTLQDKNPGSPTYGAFNWNAEDPPQDLNSAAFVGLTLADVLALDKKHPCLDADLRGEVEESVRLAVQEIMKRNCNAGYTNIALLSTALAAAGEKLLSVPGAGAWAQAKIDGIIALADDGEFAEYLSPTYNGVAVYGAYMAAKFSFSDAFGAKVNTVIDHLWKQVALSYHAPTFQLGGPYLRAYGDNMLAYAAVLKYFIYLGTGGAYPLSDSDFEHDWDQGCVMSIADLPIPPRPEFKQPPVPWRAWTAVGSPGVDANADNSLVRHLFQYRAGNFILGTVGFQDEWKQKRNLVAFWRNDGPPPLNMKVGFCIDESNETIPGFAGEKLHFYSQQVKDAALVQIVAAKAVPGTGTSTFVFDDGATMTAPESTGEPWRIEDGTITAYLYPVSNQSPRFEAVPDAAHHVMRVVRPWNSSDVVGSLHVLSYLIVFRPTWEPAPSVTDIVLKQDGDGSTASAQVDGAPLSVSSN
jgi:hypothetical protein